MLTPNAAARVSSGIAASEIGVFQVNGGTCAPLVGAQVDVWHATAEGVYSDKNRSRKCQRAWRNGMSAQAR